MSQTTAIAPRNEKAALVALDQEIEQRRAVVEESAASLIDPRRLKGVVLAAFTRNPSLWECDPVSIARAVVESAQYGLEPTGAIGGAHLVPFMNRKTGRKEAQLIIDYRGYVALARRSGEVSKVWARVVRERDEFWVNAGTEDMLHHRPYLGQDDPGNITHVYAVIRYRDGSQQFDYDNKAWVESIRKRSKAADNGPWITDWAEMAKKSILRRLLKTAPLTVEARKAIEFEEQAEAEVAQVRQGRAPASISRIHERLGIVESDEQPASASARSDDGVGAEAMAADASAPDTTEGNGEGDEEPPSPDSDVASTARAMVDATTPEPASSPPAGAAPAAPITDPDALATFAAGVLEYDEPQPLTDLTGADWDAVIHALELDDLDAFEAWHKVQKPMVRAALRGAGRSPKDRREAINARPDAEQLRAAISQED